MLNRTLLLLLCLVLTLLAACAPASGGQQVAAEADADELRATLEAELRATLEAELRPTAEAIPSATLAPTSADTATPTPSSAPTATEPAATPTVAEVLDDPATTLPTSFEPSEAQAPTTINLELVFDASGSMAEVIGSQTKIDAAREAIRRVLDALPSENAALNVGLRVFGHRGDNSEAGKAESCASSELLVPLAGVAVEQLRAQANSWEPTGWTPISLALEQAGGDFSPGENVRNLVILVTDGEETCGGDPCAVAESLAAADTKVRIDLIGLGLSPEIAEELRCISENSGGIYLDAQDGAALSNALQTVVVASLNRSYLRIVALDETGQPGDRVRLIDVLDAQGQPAEILNLPSRTLNALLADGEALLELQPGSYSFAVTKTFIQFGGDAGADGYMRTYTAVVEPGSETVAVVGIGGLTFTRGPDVSRRALCDAVFEIFLDGAWQEFPLPGIVIGCKESFIFNEEYLLPPGVYRVRDLEREMVIVDEIVIEPGRQVTVQIRA